MKQYLTILVGLSMFVTVQESSCDSTDEDGDGWSVQDGDCDDANAGTHPGAEELCDGIDNDCDDVIDDNTLGVESTCAGSSCLAILENHDDPADGDYWIDPDGDSEGFQAYCDMTTDGGGWTLFTWIDAVLPEGGWEPYMVDQYGVTRSGTALGKKPADTVLRNRVEGADWHIDMQTSDAVAEYGIDPCEEVDMKARTLVSQVALSGTPEYLEVRNNKGSGCTGIGHVYTGADVDTGGKISIKGVTPDSDGGFQYLVTWGAFGYWYGAPASSQGGYQTHCDPDANDTHYRCSGFLDDPNWTSVAMYYR